MCEEDKCGTTMNHPKTIHNAGREANRVQAVMDNGHGE